MQLLGTTYWGSLIAVLIGLIITTILVLTNGIPSHVQNLPKGMEEISTYSVIAILLIYALRYYCMVAFNAYGERGSDFKKLPKPLRILIFGLLVAINILCLLSTGAVLEFGVYLALWACIVMSFLSLLAGIVCWSLSYVDRWPKVKSIFIGAETLLFVICLFAKEILYSSSGLLPLLAVGAFFIFAHEFMRHYKPTLKNYISELFNMLTST